MVETMYLYLDVIGYKLTEIKAVKISHEINEHSRLYLSAVLEGSAKLNPVYAAHEGSQIRLENKQRKQPVLFQGMVQTIQIKHLSGVYYLEIQAVSNTFQLDVKRISRSFQDAGLTYKVMVGEILGTYGGSDFIFTEPNKASGMFTMQYEETDWAFIKRIASRFNAGLVADHRFQGAKFVFGVPHGDNRGRLEQYNFYIRKNIGDFMISSENGNTKVKDLDSIVFFVQTEEELLIGDTVTYQDKSLYVKSAKAEMTDGVLLYTCALTTRNGLSRDLVFNEKITGLSLKGKVLESVGDTVKVHLEIDAGQSAGKAWPFPYTTMYTAEGHAGWYCMPEKGDTVYIYFPNAKEETGVSVNSIREGGGVGSPEIKVFRTPNGKELKFAPEEILITCVDGSIFIRLNEGGIDIVSSKPINVNTKANMNIEAKKKVNITANDEILLSCKGSSVKLTGKVEVKGSTVKIS